MSNRIDEAFIIHASELCLVAVTSVAALIKAISK